MTTVSFSTMWAQQDRFRDIAYFAEVVAGFGFEAIEASHSTSERGLQELANGTALPLSSLHAPAPFRKLDDGRPNGDANLASLDAAERAIAISHTVDTIALAAELGLDRVVVHLGGVGNVMTPLERNLRRIVEADGGDSEEAAHLRRELSQWRSERAAEHLSAARRSLEALIDFAAPRGVALGLESRLHYHEIPHPDEALNLLRPYDNSIAGYWHDVGHCEVQARLGMIDRYSWFPKLSERCIGSHLHDVDGILDHRAPGNGDVDWTYIADGLPADALRVYEMDQRQPDDKVAASLAYLRERGVI